MTAKEGPQDSNMATAKRCSRSHRHRRVRAKYQEDFVTKQEAEMLELAYKNSLIDQKANSEGLAEIPEMKTLRPTEEEFKDPVLYIEKLAS